MHCPCGRFFAVQKKVVLACLMPLFVCVWDATEMPKPEKLCNARLSEPLRSLCLCCRRGISGIKTNMPDVTLIFLKHFAFPLK